MLNLLLIALGGGVGAVARYLVSSWIHRGGTVLFPLGTLAVNLAGCLVVGALGAWFAQTPHVREEHRTAILVGVVGAFTTFSTFGWETLQLLERGRYLQAWAYVTASVAVGLGAVWAGARVVTWLLTRSAAG